MHLIRTTLWTQPSYSRTVGSPSNPGYPFFTCYKNTVQLVIYTFDLCTMHCTLFWVICSYLFSNWICLAWQQDACLVRQIRRRLSLSLQQVHEGRIHEVLQEDGCSSIYNRWLCILSVQFACFINMPCIISKFIHIADSYLFSQVKNKPWLPWVCTWSGTVVNNCDTRNLEMHFRYFDSVNNNIIASQ